MPPNSVLGPFQSLSFIYHLLPSTPRCISPIQTFPPSPTLVYPLPTHHLHFRSLACPHLPFQFSSTFSGLLYLWSSLLSLDDPTCISTCSEKETLESPLTLPFLSHLTFYLLAKYIQIPTSYFPHRYLLDVICHHFLPRLLS